jgi:DnaJ like chaperone protein
MMFWFGLAGFFFGGFKGMVFGIIVGAFFGGHSRVQKVRYIRTAYFEALFSMLAKLAKVDGVIDSREAEVVTQFIRQSGLPDEMKIRAREIFNSAKDDPRTFEDFAREFKRLSPGQSSLHSTILVMLCQVAAADGILAPGEERCLRNAADIFGFNSGELKAILSNFFKESPRECYLVLGCTEESSDQEIKRSYKRLVKQYHPDKLVAKGLPKELMQQATQRFRQVQEAYDYVCRLRGMK